MLNPKVRISDLADTDMRQYEFVRNSRLPRDAFGDPPWYRNQDTIVFWVVVIVGLAAIIWSH
jgi:hypothetical protein